MANQVVVPLDRSPRHQDRRAILGRFDPEGPRRRRGFLASRLATARGVLRAVFETLSYLSEPRLPMPEPKRLPPPR